VDLISPHKKTDELQRVVESFVLSFFIYLLALFFFPSSIAKALAQVETPQATSFLSAVKPLMIFSVTVSTIIGLLWGLNANRDFLHRFLRHIKLTSSTARSTTWFDVFSEMQGRYAIVTLTDGRRIFGYPKMFSPDEEEGIVFLTEPAWMLGGNQLQQFEVRGVLLTQGDYKRIEFLDHEYERREKK